MTLDETFAALRSRSEMALIPYLTAGFPSLDASIENVGVLAASGADIIEIGIPFSDPVADGPTIQYASHTALENGFRLETLLDALEGITVNRPLVAMSYLNPLMAMERDKLFARLKASHITGLIVPDLPVEEADGWVDRCREHAISLVFLAAPTSGVDRLKRIVEQSEGFVYYVSLTGITGVRTTLPQELHAAITSLKKMTDKPVAVGFGISTPKHVRSLTGIADGVVVGSRFIEALRRDEDLAALTRQFKEATIRHKE